MKIYRATIYSIESDTQPYAVYIKRLGLTKPLVLDTGHTINSDPIKKSIFLMDPTGRASKPAAGDEVLCFEIDSTETWGFCIERKGQPERITNEICEGNFKTNNFVRINDSEILIEEDGTKRVFIDTESIEFTSSVKHIVQTELLQLISTTTAEISADETTINGDTSLDLTSDEVGIVGTSKAGITSALINLIGAVKLGSNSAAKGGARIGDTVSVVVTTGSSAGTYAGTITSGSTTVMIED